MRDGVRECVNLKVTSKQNKKQGRADKAAKKMRSLP